MFSDVQLTFNCSICAQRTLKYPNSRTKHNAGADRDCISARARLLTRSSPNAYSFAFRNLIVILVSSSLVAVRRIFLSPRTLHRVNPSTARSASPLTLLPHLASMAMPILSQTPRRNIESGILSGLSWQRVYWVVWISSTYDQVQKYCTLVRHQERASVMLQILSGLQGQSMRSSSRIAAGEI